MQTVIAEMARRYGATRQRENRREACKCRGGDRNGNCIGCDAVEVHKKFQRQRGRDGDCGRRGEEIREPLLPGENGMPGTAKIIVQELNGTRKEYPSIYDLELMDFDVEDENGDGIFEPGEHVFIRRIRVRNIGGYSLLLILIPMDTN